MANDLIVRRDLLPSSQKARRAAQYVRMSTDKQQYSIENQAAVIAAYADSHGLTIVETYADKGESGLRIKNRDGLKRLIQDVTSKSASFGHLLVYDVSRWGRFQDTDESAYYEFICKQAGVHVEYCAEQFSNDGSVISSIVKNIKRVMAAEYSRELSAKVHAGQCRLAALGYVVNGHVPYGLRRILVDSNSNSKGLLKKGDRKQIQNDRIKFIPGPLEETAIVEWIFRTFLELRSESKVARKLNRMGVASTTGGIWDQRSVGTVLRNDSYVGDLVFNRCSKKLKGKQVRNPPDQWVKSEGCIEPIIDRDLFNRVAQALQGRRHYISNEEMLARLRRLLKKEGRLSSNIINRAPGMPCASNYTHHFGSLLGAYRLIGYTTKRNLIFSDTRGMWRERRRQLAAQVAAAIEKNGRVAKLILPLRCAIRITDKFNIYFHLARCAADGTSVRWNVVLPTHFKCGWIVAMRLSKDNNNVIDYVLIPTSIVTGVQFYFSERMRIRHGLRRYLRADALVRSLVALATEANLSSSTKLATPRVPSKKAHICRA